jgi:hypothetical protein
MQRVLLSKRNDFLSFVRIHTDMKKLVLFILCMPVACAMEQTGVLSRFALLTHEKTHTQFYPDVTTETEDKQQQAASCFKALLQLEFHALVDCPQQPRVSFGDAKSYCEWASMYKDLPQAKEWFPVDPAIIKRYTNSIMFATFYMYPSGSPQFGPVPGQEQHMLDWACEKIWKDKEALDSVLGEQTKDFKEIHSRFGQLMAALRNFKTNPRRNNFEG